MLGNVYINHSQLLNSYHLQFSLIKEKLNFKKEQDSFMKVLSKILLDLIFKYIIVEQ